MAKREAMICDRCGATMNHHAEKLVEQSDVSEAQHANAALGGWIEEVHQCPRCGWVDSRSGG